MTLLPKIVACRYCGADIRWVRTKSGRFMALDAWPEPDGRVQLIGGQVLMAEVLRSNRAVEARARGLELFRPHAPRCPEYDRRNRDPNPDPQPGDAEAVP